MDAGQFEIIRAFSGISVELTINQLAKKIKKNYASTNKYAHELIKGNILNQKEVGHAILCSLNFNEKKTIAALVFISMSESSYTGKKGIVVSYKNKVIALNEGNLKKNIRTFDFSYLKVLCGHEEFWKAVAEVAR